MLKKARVEPAAGFLESLRSIGYRFDSAIADIVDNSISAGARNIQVFGEPQPENGMDYVAILDDGFGMDEETLLCAMRLGAKPPSLKREDTDLGRFGMGLKTASISQCQDLVVMTKRDGFFLGAEWNLTRAEVDACIDPWEITLFDESEAALYPAAARLMSLNHGTLVLWRDLDVLKKAEGRKFRVAFNRSLILLRDYLGLVFQRFVRRRGAVSIFVQDIPVSDIDPFLETNEKTKVYPVQTLPVAAGDGTCKDIYVQPFVLPCKSDLERDGGQDLVRACGDSNKDNFRKLSGFYIYRNDRLIRWAFWPRGLTPARTDVGELVRVKVDVPAELDFVFGTDVKKECFSFPSNISAQLSGLIAKCTASAHRKVNHRASVINDNPVYPWMLKRTRDGKNVVSVNPENAAYKAFSDLLSVDQKREFERYLSYLTRYIPYRDIVDEERTGRLDLDSSSPIDDEMRSYVLFLYNSMHKAGRSYEEIIRTLVGMFHNLDERNLALMLEGALSDDER